MRELSFPARLYLIVIYLLGLGLFIWRIFQVTAGHILMMAVLSLLAALFLIFKVVGATNRSHYTFSFLIYGFAFAYLNLGETLLVILISSLIEWAWNRPPWFIQAFNTACYIILMCMAQLIFGLLDPTRSLTSFMGALSIAISMGVFTVLNHLLVGVIVWLARGENFKVSGIFNTLPVLMDYTLLIFGAMLTLVWDFYPYALILFLFPLYVIYETLRIPSLEREVEIDKKTSLFNHSHFMKQLGKELDRSKRFDRPLSVIMLDLDLLRNINNTYGHLAGDEVLIGIAHILKKLVREYDVVARFGGEEFIIMLPETTLQQSFVRAELIRREIEQAEFAVPTSVVPIKATISLGLAERESFSQTAEEIIHHADTALFHSKLSGRNQSFAYKNDAYLNFFEDARKAGVPPRWQTETQPQTGSTPPAEIDFPAAETTYAQAETAAAVGPETGQASEGPKLRPEKSENRLQPVHIYIGGLALVAAALFISLVRVAPELYRTNWLQVWPGLLTSSVLVMLTELFSIDLYIGKTSLSTSAVPILAGILLFGPVAGVILCTIYAVVVGIKYHSKFNKYIFNFSNQVIAAMFYLLALHLLGKPLAAFPLAMQAILVVIAVLIVYITNTWLISFGIGIDLHQSPRKIWKEQYLWLVTIYLGIGLIATAYIVGYRVEGVLGILIMMVPLFLLRISQKQYVDRTRAAVTELREKNIVLEKNTEEIDRLNDGLLDTLAEIIDLRDPHVLGHSKRVTAYAVILAEKMGLNPKQVKLIRKASLLHDIGKLGISMDILSKPGKLNSYEYETIKKHADLGGNLVKNSPSFLPIVPIIRQHHEFYNGMGYPDKLAGNQISIEARIVAVADAIEAMTSDRPYRKKLTTRQVIDELKACSGSQFDPLVARVAIRLFEKEVELEVDQSKSQINPIPDGKTSTLPS
ncbi:MAG TPA: diguanylate cyclase [Anaerolineales bacterium]|nr:diguanylate cyclase [Anaerolineales bacterium]